MKLQSLLNLVSANSPGFWYDSSLVNCGTVPLPYLHPHTFDELEGKVIIYLFIYLFIYLSLLFFVKIFFLTFFSDYYPKIHKNRRRRKTQKKLFPLSPQRRSKEKRREKGSKKG